ncbi:hypothetical protein A9X06_15820 [Mycobacterium sp. 852002-51759_SCH5129042]|nr:hypothetical protein A9X06_15820 [Mycobacterium sp. 852002-51759_SCH5129042]
MTLSHASYEDRTPLLSDLRGAAAPPGISPFTWNVETETDHQHFGYLLAGIALERACLLTARYAATPPTDTDRDQADYELAGIDLADSPLALAHLLTCAITWRAESATANCAVPVLVEHFHHEYGLIIDTDRVRIERDHEFDLTGTYSARLVTARLARSADAVRAGRLMLERTAPTPAVAATAAALITVPRNANDVRALARTLHEAGVSDRAGWAIAFCVAYLAGHGDGIDLADSPVLVDPVDEARGEIAEQIRCILNPDPNGFSNPPTPAEVLASREFRQSMAVLSDSDRRLAESTLRDIDAFTGTVPLWSSYVARSQLDRMLGSYCAGVATLHDYARSLGTAPDHPVDPLEHRWITTLVGELADAGRVLNGYAWTGQGLISAERQQIEHTLRGALLGEPAPRLLFAGERFKAEYEFRIQSITATELVDSIQERLVTMIEDGGIALPHIELDEARFRHADSMVHHVEPEASVLAVVESLHRLALPRAEHGLADEHTAAVQRLHASLNTAHAPQPLHERVAALVDAATAHAKECGTRWSRRGRYWDARIAAVVKTWDHPAPILPRGAPTIIGPAQPMVDAITPIGAELAQRPDESATSATESTALASEGTAGTDLAV